MINTGRSRFTQEINLNPVFALASSLYIAGIFLMADPPTEMKLIQTLNPYSRGHVPLYGALTVLLILTFRPPEINQANSLNRLSLALPSFVAVGVAVLDEFHQASVPGRDASVIDALLDGVGLAIFVYPRWTEPGLKRG